MHYDEDDKMNFTMNAWNSLYDAVDDTYFRENDADLIYKTLENNLRHIPFGEYLKRYIYKSAEIDIPYEQVPLKEYQMIIKDSFSDNYTPASFIPTTAKLSALAKNWLSQQTVKRNVVFLLGFGLAMSVEDVNEFLTKALHEQGINAKDPFEVICWYCYKNRYGYPKFSQLWQQFGEMTCGNFDMKMVFSDQTVGVRNTMYAINSDESLLVMLSTLKYANNKTRFSVTAKKHFDILYRKTQELIVDIYNNTEEEKLMSDLAEYRRKLENNDRLYDVDKLERINTKRANKRVYTCEDVTESDIERIICSAIPTDRHGNLTPSKASKLNDQFAGKRFSRQHIGEILSGKTEVNRFDLITLNFFIFSQNLDEYSNAQKRYVAFIESTNKILEDCFLAPLYITNPYECFVMMCILSDDPLGTYADVWELSFAELDD